MGKPENTPAAGQREQFGSRISFVLASMGGAIGLGIIWKFPYLVGRHGGAAFIVVYLAALVLVAVPVLVTEFTIGRKTGTSYTSALKKLLPQKKWYLVGILGVIALTLTLSFYCGIAGWTVAYLLKSVTGAYNGMAADQVVTLFSDFTANPWQMLLWLAVMLLITTVVVLRGVKGGIEKVCNILLPLMFLFIIFLAVRAIMLPGAREGIKFYLLPDFSSLNGEAIMAAIGQSFFALGVGCGNLVVYGSYLDRKKTIGSSTLMVVLGDTVVAILFGLIIFPAAAAFNIEAGMGPPLVFITLPAIFSQMKFGMVFATIFFIMMFFACLTSTICIMEAIVGYLVDEFHLSRRFSCWIVTGIVFAIGSVMMMSYGPLANVLIMGQTIFDFFNDTVVSAILLPLGALLMVLLAGWVLKPGTLLDEANIGEGLKINRYYTITIRYIAPVAIFFMFLQLIGVIRF
ncbi:sodium-dependent transporter [Anaerotruncus colihominis]|uniref:sodium-dependent transporter n=1 Tax=Anaerotruncus colihominis TaxID=169435 RepID=UPI003516142B